MCTRYLLIIVMFLLYAYPESFRVCVSRVNSLQLIAVMTTTNVVVNIITDCNAICQDGERDVGDK